MSSVQSENNVAQTTTATQEPPDWHKNGIIPLDKERWQLQWDPIPGLSLQDTLQRSFWFYRPRQFLGTRMKDASGKLLNEISWKTFGDVWNDFITFGSGLLPFRVHVGIYARNCYPWVITDFASRQELEYIMNHAETSVVVVSREFFKPLLESLRACPKVKTVILIEPLVEEDLFFAHSLAAGVRIVDFDSIGRFVSLQGVGKYLPMIKNDEDSLMTLLYTSGSTGTPKGAMNSYRRWNSFISPIYRMPQPLVRLSFNPLAHTTERQLTWLTMAFGGRQMFSTGDMQVLFDEFQLVQITALSAPPRLYDFIYAEFKHALQEAQRGVPVEAHEAIRVKVLAQMKSLLGGNIKQLVIGGAASSPKVREFIAECFQCEVHDGYGTTEAGSIASNYVLFPHVNARLESIEEMGYTTEDKPYPRGEIIVQTKQMISGYYKDAKSTKENFTKDGWFRTGDVGEKREDGTIRIVGRCKNIFKMAQGVFVEPTRIETLLLESRFVEQIYVHGEIVQPSLVAIIVPNSAAALKWAKDHQIEETELSRLYRFEPLRKAILHDIATVAKRLGIHGYEMPTGVFLEHEKFTPDNHLLTVSSKPMRRNLANHYKDIIAKLYAESEQEKATMRVSLRDIIQSELGVDLQGDVNVDLISQIGTDSLSSVKLVNLLKDKFQKDIPLSSLITGQSVTLESLAKLLADPSATLSEERNELAVEDLKNVSTFTLTVPPFDLSLISNPKSVLVTGATGFLGAFLLHRLLLSSPVRVFVLLRRKDDSKQKLDPLTLRTTSTLSEEEIARSLLARLKRQLTFFGIPWDEAWNERIVPLDGDLSLPSIGLSAHVHERVCAQVDVIYHVAAIVNWLVRYPDVRATNVFGTIELLKVAATVKAKLFVEVSTLSASQYQEGVLMREETAFKWGGYGLSKWIAEHYVLRAKSMGLPVMVMQPGMITAHTAIGACNPTDFTTRLIQGLVTLEAYFENDNFMEFIPVDWLANAIFNFSREPRALGVTFHLNNPRFLTYEKLGKLVSHAGHSLKKLPYAEWRKLLLETVKTKETSLSSLLSYFTEEFHMTQIVYDRTNTERILKELDLQDAPFPEASYIEKCIRYMERVGQLPKPSS